MYIFTVDGNIGSGKSTLIKLMKQKYKEFLNTWYIESELN